MWCHYWEILETDIIKLTESLFTLIPLLRSSATRSDIAAPEGPGIAEEEHNGEDDDADDTNKEALHLEPPLAAEPVLQHLRDCITEHINTPASVASGMSGLSHKVSTFVWQSALGVPTMRALKLFLASFMAMTSDFGTEIGIAGFEAESLESLLPSWFHLPRGEPEVDGRARQDEGDIEYDCEMPDCSSSATVERDVMSADESAHDEATERESQKQEHMRWQWRLQSLRLPHHRALVSFQIACPSAECSTWYTTSCWT